MHLQHRLASQIQQMLFQVSFAVICNRYALYMSHLDITLIPLTVRIGIVMSSLMMLAMTLIMVVFSWGVHAEIVSKSNYLRSFMGNSRFSVVAGFLLWLMPRYIGKLVMDGAQKYDAVSQSWQTATESTPMEGNFTYFLAAKMPELEPGFCIAPFASTSDDFVDLVLLSDETRDELKNILCKAIQKGGHINEPKLEY